MKILIAAVLLLTACGVDEKQLKDQYTYSQSGGIENAPAGAKEVVVEYRKDDGELSLVVADTKDLPTCSNDNFGQSAYVKAVDQFFRCAGTAWQLKALKEPSKAVSKVEAVSVPEEAALPSEYTGTNVWIDPITGREWAVLGQFTRASGLYGLYTACIRGYTLPDRLLAKEAVRNGLFTSFGAHNIHAVWTKDFTPLQATVVYTPPPGTMTRMFVDAAGDDFAADLSNAFTGVACLKE